MPETDPTARPPRVSLIDLHARELAGMGDDWEPHYYERHPPTLPTIYFEVRGAVAPILTRGPRKGRRDWKRSDPATERRLYIPVADHDAWVARWVERTGKCPRCVGTGEVFASWDRGEGTTYATCRDCGGTGAAPRPETQPIQTEAPAHARD